MAKIEKLVAKFLSNPKDLTWDELVNILKYFGFNELKSGKTSGSRRKFVDSSKRLILLHEPHPQKILKAYQIKLIIENLKQYGLI
jgi:hypothetical protein